MTWKPDVCVHHHPCDDGFCSAWVARRKWPDLVTKGTNYGLPFPDVDIDGKNLLIVDFSYKHHDTLDLALRAKSIVILDHHKTAEAELDQFRAAARDAGRPGFGRIFSHEEVDGSDWFPATRNIVAYFDMDRSGAALTWDFCFPGEPMPRFIELIEDRDLWRFQYPTTRAFTLLLRSYPYDFEHWDAVADAISRDTGRVLAEAKAIERFYDQKILEIIPTATLRKIGKWEGVPVAHAPYSFASDVAHQLLRKYPAAPFAAVVVDAYGARTWSLRSDDSREDVSEVAKSFGGGGHRNASGFRTLV